MDFAFDESEQALIDLVEQIVSDNVDHQRLRALEAAGARVDRKTWNLLAQAGVMAALLPERVGGGGLGSVATGGVLEVVARHAAALPMLSTVVGAFVVADGARGDAHAAVLAEVMDGTRLVAVIAGGSVVAVEHEQGWSLSGSAPFVSNGLDADTLVVGAEVAGIADQQAVFVVEADRGDVVRHEQPVTTGYSDASVTFHDAVVADTDRLEDGAAALLRQRLEVAVCAMTAGLAQGALSLAADYAQQRVQFDRVIASFQAVSQRIADAYIDLQGIELTSRQAAWRLDAGLDARREIAIARWWAAEAGNRIVHAAVHVHGGVGVDRDYPLHRHFLLARKLELSLGTSEDQLAALGAAIALGEPV